ncbi:MAG: hypothetical protein AB7K68_11605 [Bacteriovoracia bacterium]
MEIMGSIQGENVVISERERIQKLMRDFIGILRLRLELNEVAYRVHFWRPFLGAKIDSLIEFRANGQDAWCARANGPDAWRAFSRALGSLKQMIMEIEIREDSQNANRITSV